MISATASLTQNQPTHYLHAVDTKLYLSSSFFLHLQQYCTKTNEITNYQAYKFYINPFTAMTGGFNPGGSEAYQNILNI